MPVVLRFWEKPRGLDGAFSGLDHVPLEFFRPFFKGNVSRLTCVRAFV